MQSNFGEEIRRRRQALGLTLEQLAERSGLTPNYIGTIESGKRDPSLSTIRSLAKGLGVFVGELFGSMPNLTPLGEEAGRLSAHVPQEIQNAVLAILRTYSKKRRA